jgi:DNA-directed RNA polymerase specialized sigma24 family protein
VPATDQGRDSFGDFVAAALPGLLRFGHVLTGDPRKAEDLVQEALARTLRRWRTVSHDNAVAYVRRVMVNTHINRWRRWESRAEVRFLPVIYSGPLRSYHPAKGSWSLASVVATGCGSRIARDTWLIISGHPASPSRAAGTLFLNRHGRVLLYNATSRPA